MDSIIAHLTASIAVDTGYIRRALVRINAPNRDEWSIATDLLSGSHPILERAASVRAASRAKGLLVEGMEIDAVLSLLSQDALRMVRRGRSQDLIEAGAYAELVTDLTFRKETS